MSKDFSVAEFGCQCRIDDFKKNFRIHPRKLVKATPTHDAQGRELPKTIFEAYKKPSRAKQVAALNCCVLCELMGGFNFRITAHTCQFFTVSFDFANPETGEYMRAVITAHGADAYYVGDCNA